MNITLITQDDNVRELLKNSFDELSVEIIEPEKVKKPQDRVCLRTYATQFIEAFDQSLKDNADVIIDANYPDREILGIVIGRCLGSRMPFKFINYDEKKMFDFSKLYGDLNAFSYFELKQLPGDIALIWEIVNGFFDLTEKTFKFGYFDDNDLESWVLLSLLYTHGVVTEIISTKPIDGFIEVMTDKVVFDIDDIPAELQMMENGQLAINTWSREEFYSWLKDQLMSSNGVNCDEAQAEEYITKLKEFDSPELKNTDLFDKFKEVGIAE